MSGAKKKDAGAKDIGFEGAVERLEAIVAEMEGGTLRLEDMMTRFEEGQKLIKLCSGKLNEVERKVEILVKKGETVSEAPFGGESEGEGAVAGDTSEDAAVNGELF